MDWFTGLRENLNRKPLIVPLKRRGFPVNCPLNESIDGNYETLLFGVLVWCQGECIS